MDKQLLNSKLPKSGLSIFSRMTSLALKNDAVNLAQGFPDFPCPGELSEALYRATQDGYNQYGPMPGFLPLRENISKRIQKTYSVQIDAQEEITITAGATQGVYSAISTLVSPGDKVIIFEPAYDSYAPSVLVNKGEPIYIRLEEPEFKIPWDKLEQTLRTQEIRLILFNNPHNPTGVIWEEEDFQKLISLLHFQKPLMIWDEVYDAMVYDGKKHLSALQYPELYESSIVTFSFGKTFHNTGWKIGYNIAPPHLTAEYRKLHQFTLFSVNYPSQVASSYFLERNFDFIKDLSSFYQKKRDHMINLLKQTEFSALSCRGSYFLLASHEAMQRMGDTVFAGHIVENHKVALIPLSAFYHDGYDPHLLRFCFAKKESTVEQAVERLKRPTF